MRSRSSKCVVGGGCAFELGKVIRRDCGPQYLPNVRVFDAPLHRQGPTAQRLTPFAGLHGR
jgi:hypothetical protein